MTIKHKVFLCLLIVFCSQAQPHIARAQSTTQPDELQAIFNCKIISNPQERLACYDSFVGKLEAAEKMGEIVTVRKTAIEKVERDAFGFNIPSLPSLGKFFRGDKNAASDTKAVKPNPLKDPVKQAEIKAAPQPPAQPPAILPKPQASKIKDVTLEIRKTTEFGYKKKRFFMANGQVWEQIDSLKVRVPKVRHNKPNTAAISKASLGSYFLRVNGTGAAIRVRRVR